MGIQILRALTGSTVVALDLSGEKLELAREVGAHETLPSNDGAIATIRAMTDGQGATAVFDFVGAAATAQLAGAIAAAEGDVTIVGIAGGALPVGFGTVGFDVAVRTTYWGTRSELMEVLELARRGQVSVEVERFGLDEAPQAYELLHEGKIRGRAVVVPSG